MNKLLIASGIFILLMSFVVAGEITLKVFTPQLDTKDKTELTNIGITNLTISEVLADGTFSLSGDGINKELSIPTYKKTLVENITIVGNETIDNSYFTASPLNSSEIEVLRNAEIERYLKKYASASAVRNANQSVLLEGGLIEIK